MREQPQMDPTEREFVTEVLDESSWPNILTTIVELLLERNVKSVIAEYGFVLKRDLRGEVTPEDCIVPLAELQALMERGFREGTIEWGHHSDFRFVPAGLPIRFMLCNDADLHFWSSDPDLLLDLTRRLSGCDVKVYNGASGELIETNRQ
ncbi:MAG: hypothetical protein ABSB50_16060 [Terracidiphilus sp.]